MGTGPSPHIFLEITNTNVSFSALRRCSGMDKYDNFFQLINYKIIKQSTKSAEFVHNEPEEVD